MKVPDPNPGHEELRRALDLEGELEREVLAEIASMRGAPGEERIAGTIQTLRGQRAPRNGSASHSGNRRWGLVALTAVAAAALFVVFTQQDPGESSPSNLPAPRLLGGPVDPELVPHGEVPHTWNGSFSWPQALSEEGAYQLLVYAWSDGARLEPPLVDEIIETEGTWAPDGTTRQRIQAAGEIEWEVGGLTGDFAPLSGRRRSSWASFSSD